MIRIHYQPEGINIEGHAGFAELGQDIVCAGVSALALTLVRVLKEDYNILTQETVGHINITFSNKLDEKGKYFIKGIMFGLREIAKEYPDFVKLTENPYPH